jgi:hypothetical protein
VLHNDCVTEMRRGNLGSGNPTLCIRNFNYEGVALKEGEDWPEPFLNVNSPLSSHSVSSFFICLSPIQPQQNVC